MTSLACCAGKVDEGSPKGTLIRVEDIECYQAQPTEVKNKDTLIIVATDVFGHSLPNSQLLADKFAEACGAVCLVPDMFSGRPLPAHLMEKIEVLTEPGGGFFAKIMAFFTLFWHFPGFLIRNPVAKSITRIEKVIQFYRKQGFNKVAASGYCWGGRVATVLGQKNGVIDVFCAAHPGGLKLPQDIDALVTPAAYVLTPDKDMQIKHPEAKVLEEALEKKSFPHIVKCYANMHHGFAVRGGKQPDVAEKRQDAFEVAANFFIKVLDLV